MLTINKESSLRVVVKENGGVFTVMLPSTVTSAPIAVSCHSPEAVIQLLEHYSIKIKTITTDDGYTFRQLVSGHITDDDMSWDSLLDFIKSNM